MVDDWLKEQQRGLVSTTTAMELYVGIFWNNATWITSGSGLLVVWCNLARCHQMKRARGYLPRKGTAGSFHDNTLPVVPVVMFSCSFVSFQAYGGT